MSNISKRRSKLGKSWEKVVKEWRHNMANQEFDFYMKLREKMSTHHTS